MFYYELRLKSIHFRHVDNVFPIHTCAIKSLEDSVK